VTARSKDIQPGRRFEGFRATRDAINGQGPPSNFPRPMGTKEGMRDGDRWSDLEVGRAKTSTSEGSDLVLAGLDFECVC